jgi:hypothetical protein
MIELHIWIGCVAVALGFIGFTFGVEREPFSPAVRAARLSLFACAFLNLVFANALFMLDERIAVWPSLLVVAVTVLTPPGCCFAAWVKKQGQPERSAS